jgi:hypothetical protein
LTKTEYFVIILKVLLISLKAPKKPKQKFRFSPGWLKLAGKYQQAGLPL